MPPPSALFDYSVIRLTSRPGQPVSIGKLELDRAVSVMKLMILWMVVEILFRLDDAQIETDPLFD